MLGAVMFVFKLAHDLFDGVFDGDQTGDAAILVHHDRHMLTRALHLMK